MKIQAFILIVICSCCFTTVVKATGQIGERLIVGRDTLAMLACPLETDTTLSRKVSERIDQKDFCTALWRGYIGTWRLENKMLYLEEIKTLRGKLVNTSGIFDDYEEDGRIVARWFSGEIRVTRGKNVIYEHMGFARHGEHETIYTLRKGRVVSQKEIYNSIQKGSNENSYYTMNMLFNGKGMRWEGDSTLKIKIIPNPDGTVNRVKVSRYLGFKESKKTREQMKAKLERLKSKRNSKKALDRYFSRNTHYQYKKYGTRHPYTREVMACVNLMGKWEVLTLDNKIQPIRTSIIWGKDRSIMYQKFWSIGTFVSPDSLYLDGELYRVDAFPLQQNPDLVTRLRPHLKGAFTTEDPRGYISRWKIEDGRLWLTEVRNTRTGELIPLSELAPGNNGEPLEATWYTGIFEIAAGDPIGEDFYWYDTERREIICEVKQGKIVRQTVHENYIQPGDTAAYNHFVDVIRSHDWNHYPELKNRSLTGELTVYPRVDGVADSIRAINLYINGDHVNERYHLAISDPANPWIKLVQEAANTVPRWEVHFIKGKVKPLKIYLDIKSIEEKKPIDDEKTITIDLREIGGGKVLGK